MARLALLLSAVVSVGFAPAPLPRPRPRSDLEKMQGAWVMVMRTYGATEIRVDKEDPRLEVRGDRMTWQYPGKPSEWQVRLVPGSRPKALDLTGLTGQAAGRRSLAVYAIAGDTLTLCYSQAGPRPADLDGRAPTQWRMVYRRKP